MNRMMVRLASTQTVMADLISGAVLGALVGELLKKVINAAKLVYCCKTNCESLVTTLNDISPILEDIARSADAYETCQAWLKSIHGLLVEAESIVEKCTSKDASGLMKFMRKPKLSSRIVKIERKIQEKPRNIKI